MTHRRAVRPAGGAAGPIGQPRSTHARPWLSRATSCGPKATVR